MVIFANTSLVLSYIESFYLLIYSYFDAFFFNNLINVVILNALVILSRISALNGMIFLFNAYTNTIIIISIKSSLFHLS